VTAEEKPPTAPGRLFTWVDVDRHFAALATVGRWPAWLREVDAYWDGVEFTIATGTAPDSVWNWLTARLGTLTVDPERQTILLESTGDEGRTLDVQLRVDEAWVDAIRQPRWNEPRVVRKLAESLPVPDRECFPHDVRICAFHSFRGGVGRTLHCVALARELAARAADHPAGKRVLLVDADMEAPGISGMVASGGDQLDFAFDDFVALLHGSTDGGNDAIGLARKFLLNRERDGVVVLPTTRDPMRVGPPRIEPVDLLSHHRPPYLLTESLARLTHAVGADTVVIDLRAGTSELNAPVLLDPRVRRVFVTTISDQSVHGTVHLLDTLAHRAPSSRITHPACAVLITQFQEKEHSTQLAKAVHTLKEAVARTIDGSTLETDATDTTTDQDVITEPLSSPFLSPLLALPGSWNEVCDHIEQTNLRSVVSDLADTLRPRSGKPPTEPGVVARRGQERWSRKPRPVLRPR
jgi:ATPases involved in chromosome partitioning